MMVTTPFLESRDHGVLRDAAHWKAGFESGNDNVEEHRPTKRARTALAILDVHCRSGSFQNIELASIEQSRPISTENIRYRDWYTQATGASPLRPKKTLPLRAKAINSDSSLPPSHGTTRPFTKQQKGTSDVLSLPPPPRFSGDFDLFLTTSSFIPQHLSSVSNHKDAYRSLYGLLTGATASSPDAQCHLPIASRINSNAHTTLSANGFIQSDLIRDPADDERLVIGLHDIREVGGNLERKSFDDDMMVLERPSSTSSISSTAAPPKPTSPTSDCGPYLYAGAHVIGDGSIGDIVDSFGEFAMGRIWYEFADEEKEEDGQGKELSLELFRARCVLRVFFGDGYVTRGHPEVGVHCLDFWAVHKSSEDGGLEGHARRAF